MRKFGAQHVSGTNKWRLLQSSPLPPRDPFQDPRWVPETTDSTKPCM